MQRLDPGSHPPESVPPCPVCGGAEAQPRFEIPGVAWRVVVCSGCGLGRAHPLPSIDQVQAFYPGEYYGEPGTKFQPLIERLVRVVGARHIGFLSRSLVARSRILDVGCGRGVVLGELADSGFEVHGVEMSSAAAHGADPRARIRVAPRLVDAGYESESFDEVVIWHVLEHLDDPRGTLEEVRRILRPGGRLIVAVPNFSSVQARWAGPAWFHLDLPRHLYHFPLDALHHLLRVSGFEVDSTHHFSLRQNLFGWIQSALNRSTSLPRNGLYTLLHRRGAGSVAPFPFRIRLTLWLWLVIGAPLAALASVLAALARSGATVHVVARRRQGAAPAQAPERAPAGAST